MTKNIASQNNLALYEQNILWNRKCVRDFDPIMNSFQDPYAEEPMRCVLCPKNFSVPIRPSWKNPKLLSQFVSPHTGLVYKKHITGLCEFMQCEVELEVKRAQQFGKIFISSFLESNQQTEILLYEPTTSLFRCKIYFLSLYWTAASVNLYFM